MRWKSLFLFVSISLLYGGLAIPQVTPVEEQPLFDDSEPRVEVYEHWCTRDMDSCERYVEMVCAWFGGRSMAWAWRRPTWTPWDGYVYICTGLCTGAGSVEVRCGG